MNVVFFRVRWGAARRFDEERSLDFHQSAVHEIFALSLHSGTAKAESRAAMDTGWYGTKAGTLPWQPLPCLRRDRRRGWIALQDALADAPRTFLR